jgi:hypothetical protein
MDTAVVHVVGCCDDGQVGSHHLVENMTHGFEIRFRHGIILVSFVLILIRQLQKDFTILGKNVIVHDGYHGAGRRGQTELLEFDFGTTELVVSERIFVHDFNLEHHVLQANTIGQGKGERFAPDGIDGVCRGKKPKRQT